MPMPLDMTGRYCKLQVDVQARDRVGTRRRKWACLSWSIRFWNVWNCYTVVFDRQNSRIRIAGLEEPLHCESLFPPTFHPFLDGLTIGSDHTFDMSLCFGHGSGGGGEGEGEGGWSWLKEFLE
jgi:hypothetical protein